MKRDMALWEFCGFAAVSFLGTLLHFLYDWTGSPVAALVSGVNESTWEHMKLLYFPMLLFAFVQSFYIGRAYENFWCVKLRGALVGLALIPILFYTMRGIFGTTPDFVNIAIFFVSAAGAYWYETKEFEKKSTGCPYRGAAIVLLLLIAAAFWVFTFYPPEIPLFIDPLTGTAGI